MSGTSLFHRIDSIPASPEMNPHAFCRAQPCVDVKIGAHEFILNQPTSTAIVYALGRTLKDIADPAPAL